MNVTIAEDWKRVLQKQFDAPYFAHIANTLKLQKQQGKTIFPPGSLIFNAFNTTPLQNIKVVILGQDPYHAPGQAHGLCFSVMPPTPPPPSLVNIYKELKDDVGFTIPGHGNLTGWAQQGVFLLNASLTVLSGQPMSHAHIGWADFTNSVIQTISDECNNVVFLLWGKFAQQKQTLIDAGKHCILTAAHPSPLSAYNGFFGCKHFSKANSYLMQHNKTPINWQL